jgi:hypothetical protein
MYGKRQTSLAADRASGVSSRTTRGCSRETGIVVHQPGVVGPGVNPAVGQSALELVSYDPPARGQPDGVLVPDMHPVGGCTGHGETGDVG